MTGGDDRTTPHRPAVSVVIGVYNGARYLRSAIASVTAQTLRDIEIVVVDDASTDRTPEILADLAAKDERIRVFRLDTNARLPGALNHGLDRARAPLIARMDADDICYPRRLEIQKARFDADPGLGILGTSFRYIDADGTPIRAEVKDRDDFECRWGARFHTPLRHPSVMFRAEMPDGARLRYDERFSVAEDFDLFTRIMRHAKIVEIPDVLLDYRVHEGNVTKTKAEEQRRQALAISRSVIAHECSAATADAIEPVILSNHGGQRFPPRVILGALRTMLAEDVAAHPHRAAWLRREVAGLAFEMFDAAGLSRADKLRILLGPGRDIALPLVRNRIERAGRARRCREAFSRLETGEAR